MSFRAAGLVRWSAPAVVALGIAAATLAPQAFAGSAPPKLPAKTAAELLAAVEGVRVHDLSGEFQTTARLGFPQLPEQFTVAGSGLSSFQALLTGTHTLDLWVRGVDQQRVALLSDLSETDVVHNGADLWTYNSTTHAVTHATVPTLPDGTDKADGTDNADSGIGAESGTEAQLTPQAQAEKALKAIDPTTAVTVDDTAWVAHRAAYDLVLTPRTTKTLIGSVRIAIDAATSMPLRVQLFARGSSSPAFETAFTKLSLETPDASRFDFVPPAGAEVTEQQGFGGSDQHRSTSQRSQPTGHPTTVGEGWASVLVLPAGTMPPDPAAAPGSDGESNGSLIDEVTKAVPQGRLLSTSLLSVLIADDGRIYVGAVPPATLEAAAAAQR